MPAPRETMTLGDLREWHMLAVMCGSCGHGGMLSPRRLRRRWGADRVVASLDSRMRCTRCSRRGGHAWTVVRMPRND